MNQSKMIELVSLSYKIYELSLPSLADLGNQFSLHTTFLVTTNQGKEGEKKNNNKYPSLVFSH